MCYFSFNFFQPLKTEIILCLWATRKPVFGPDLVHECILPTPAGVAAYFCLSFLSGIWAPIRLLSFAPSWISSPPEAQVQLLRPFKEQSGKRSEARGPVDQQWPGWQVSFPNVVGISTSCQHIVPSLALKGLHFPQPLKLLVPTWLVLSSEYEKKWCASLLGENI